MVGMKTRLKSTHAALYGNVAIQRQYCRDCLDWSLVIKGKFACCSQTASGKPTRYKRMSCPEAVKKSPPRAAATAQLAAQQHRCFYCDLEFGNYITRHGNLIRLIVAWDHFVPWSYSQDNAARNFVAACQVCNGLKWNRCFGSVDEAKSYIASQRAAKGYV